MRNLLFQEIRDHWQQLRGMTYDLLAVISDNDLVKRLPFSQSQDLAYQFNCMVGAQESNIPFITEGKWKGFSSSLNQESTITVETIKTHMELADNSLINSMKNIDLLNKFSNGSTPLLNYMVLVEHESHHQGQIINYIYALNLPIPKSWTKKWALTK